MSAARKEAVVLIHGLWMPGLVMEPMRWRLEQRHGFAVHTFSYPSVAQGLAANVSLLRDFLKGINSRRLHLVGHSLGGVLALRTLARMRDAPPGRVVCVGSPLVGSGAARSLERWQGGDLLLGKLIREAVLSDPLQRYEGKREVGVIAGDGGFGAGVLLSAFEGPHDGTVAVEETRLPGITDHVVLPVNHTWMLISRDVADQAGHFLKHGAFKPVRDRG